MGMWRGGGVPAACKMPCGMRTQRRVKNETAQKFSVRFAWAFLAGQIGRRKIGASTLAKNPLYWRRKKFGISIPEKTCLNFSQT